MRCRVTVGVKYPFVLFVLLVLEICAVTLWMPSIHLKPLHHKSRWDKRWAVTVGASSYSITVYVPNPRWRIQVLSWSVMWPPGLGERAATGQTLVLEVICRPNSAAIQLFLSLHASSDPRFLDLKTLVSCLGNSAGHRTNNPKPGTRSTILTIQRQWHTSLPT